MAFRYVVKKRVFGFDKSKSEKYVAASFSIGEISYDRLCRPGYERGYGSARRCKNGYGRTD